MKPKLTEKQKTFLHYLKREIEQTGEAPSLRKAGEHFGLSYSSIRQLIDELEKKEYIKRDGHYSRTIHILNQAGEPSQLSRGKEIPIIGKIAAGFPLYAQQEWDGTVYVDSSFYKGDNLFALKVDGDSMKNAAILNGDIVICTPRQFAEDGEIVAALVNNSDATVKRFFQHEDKIELMPENPRFKRMFYNFDEVLIQGKVIGVQRQLAQD